MRKVFLGFVVTVLLIFAGISFVYLYAIVSQPNVITTNTIEVTTKNSTWDAAWVPGLIGITLLCAALGTLAAAWNDL